MKRRWFLVSAPLVCAAAPYTAQAAEKIQFDVPSGPLNAALVSFATQARISIDTSDPSLRVIRVDGLRGHFTVRDGLERLLRGTGYGARISRGNVVRIFRQRAQPVRREASRKPTPIPSPMPMVVPQPPPEPIIVTASKRDMALADYAGAIHVASFDETQSLRFGNKGSEVLLRELPNLASTDLGSGRNKIFIRGIADSSFNGQSQATVSQYFGESRLTYSAPDPDLALYDIEKVEVVEGPQGTLYGAGSIGGVIRVVPRSPELGVSEYRGTAGIAATGNEIGGDAAVVANMSLGEHLAVRAVGYRITRPGYIDDTERGLADINRTGVSGLRATVRFEPRDGLSFEAGLVGQNTGSRDGQYTDAPGSSALTRRSFLPQPFDNDYRLAFGTVRADLGFAKLTSNTSYTDHSIDTVFDATSPVLQVPTRFEEDLRVQLLTHETRISGTSDWLSNWVAGVSLARNINHVSHMLGPLDNVAVISKSRSKTIDAALFGEATMPLWPRISITGGGRLSYVRNIDEFNLQFGEASLEPVQSEVRFLPTVAISWKPWSGTIGYARYQEGFRPGAQQLAGTSDEAITRFEADEIRTSEIGLRFGTNPGSRVSGGISYAYSRWNRVQADLVTSDGFPYVANLGSGFVRYTSADLAWRPTAEFNLGLSGFLATSHLDRPTPAFSGAGERDLPNIADKGWHVSARYEPFIGDTKITVDGSIGYIGTSYLGVGAPFDLAQGDYLDTSIGARAEFGRLGVSVDVENLLDSRANRFSYGNPFSVAAGNQRTPLRPRTIRIGIDARF